MSFTPIFLPETLIFHIVWLVWLSPSNVTLIPHEGFIKTYIGYLAKENTNKAYQERMRDSIWKNEKICSHYSNEIINNDHCDHCDTINEWNTLIYMT
jgi:hypothetical protein